jgi:uncharacterized protein YqeY
LNRNVVGSNARVHPPPLPSKCGATCGTTNITQNYSRNISYLQKQLADAIAAAIAEIKASSIKDMGRVVGALKGKYAGRMDFAKASALVKGKLGG